MFPKKGSRATADGVGGRFRTANTGTLSFPSEPFRAGDEERELDMPSAENLDGIPFARGCSDTYKGDRCLHLGQDKVLAASSHANQKERVHAPLNNNKHNINAIQLYTCANLLLPHVPAMSVPVHVSAVAQQQHSSAMQGEPLAPMKGAWAELG